MVFLDEALLAAARACKLGRAQPRPALAALGRWIASEYSVRVVHLVHDTIDIGAAAGTPRLRLVLETDADRAILQQDSLTIAPAVRRAVAHRLADLAAELEPGQYETRGLHLVTDSFADGCLGLACKRFFARDREQVIAEFAAARIWRIEGLDRLLVVFLPTDDDVRAAAADGTSAAIAARCIELVRRHDEFDYLTTGDVTVRIDSRQNLDRHYRGNLFLYFR